MKRKRQTDGHAMRQLSKTYPENTEEEEQRGDRV